jgi:hypothetical protein
MREEQEKNTERKGLRRKRREQEKREGGAMTFKKSSLKR